MSEVQTSEYTIHTDEWWWIGAILGGLLATTVQQLNKQSGEHYRWSSTSGARGITFGVKQRSTWVFNALLTGKDGTLQITIVSNPLFTNLWRDSYFPFLEATASQARHMRRSVKGIEFHEILEEYYARRARGDRVKLKDLAERQGVNYASLRQYKIRYDAERRKDKNASDD
jgi:hypothetical protein